MTHILLRVLIAPIVLAVTSCASETRSQSLVDATAAMNLCAAEAGHFLGHDEIRDADRAYVEMFKNGYTVSFSRGEVGTFGKRASNYKQIFACGLSGNDIVFLGVPFKDPFIDKPASNNIQNYKENVVELLFRRADGGFAYCCSQVFHENNLYKHNPELRSIERK